MRGASQSGWLILVAPQKLQDVVLDAGREIAVALALSFFVHQEIMNICHGDAEIAHILYVLVSRSFARSNRQFRCISARDCIYVKAHWPRRVDSSLEASFRVGE